MLQIRTTGKTGYSKKKKKTNLSQVSTVQKQSKNNGGVLGGLGYVGGSIAAGIGGIGEGILDLGAAGIALLGGDKEYAKYVFKDNVVGDWHQSLTEDYNPGKVMQFIGDVGQGLGQSATMLIPYVGVPAFFLGVGSQGISGAAEKTGDVGFKEVAYGATTGAIEGTLEWALGAAGQGAKSIASAIAKRGGKKAAKTVLGRAVRQGLAGKILSSAAGEFLEEAASEVVDVGLQRLYRIDPNASTSLKDVLYAGIVGAVSGGIMGGSVNVVQTLNNRATGRKIVQDGNAQTLINTANLVADKLAGQGTNFRKAPEWVKTLRGEIDAYNKLVEKGEQNSAKGETILGEMQASLFFAETQAVASGLAYSIQQSSEENRATLAEYVNQTIPKNKRAREYTAEDIAKDTDGITLQLAILQFAGNEFINYADAISSLEAEQAQEGAIGDVVGAMQEESAEEPSPSTASTPLPKGEAVQGADVQGEAAPSAETVTVNQESSAGGAANQANAGIFGASAGVSTEGEAAKSDLASPLTDAKYSAARAERARQARLDQEGRMVEGTNQEQSAERKNEPSPSPSSDGATSPEVGGNNEPKIRKPKEEILTDVQRAERAKERAKRLIEYEATVKVTSKELNTAREYVKDFDSIPKGARQAVVKMIRSADGKIDKKILAGVANLMTMRRKNGELVMPDLELRFAEGIVDGGLYTHIGEGENRRVLILINSDADFKETIRGTIAHEVVHYIENRKGYRELADYVIKTAKKEKIAEIEKEYNEHYKAIYAEEAREALSGADGTTSPEGRGIDIDAEIKKKVAERMATEEHRELIKSEVVAKLIGLRLNNEKFLKKYATKDDAMIKKIFRFLRASVSYLKDKDKSTAAEVRELVLKFNDVLGGQVVSESTDTKYTVAESKNQSDKAKKKKPKEYKTLGDKITEEDRQNDTYFAEAEARAYEGEIREYILQNARYYYKSEFNKAFWDAKSVGGEVLGDILSEKKTSVKGDDLDRIKSAVYTAMYKASAEGKVGAVDAVKEIAEKAAQRYIDNQIIYDEESQRWIPLKKYVDDSELIFEYEKALSEKLFSSFANSGKNLRNFQNFSLQKKAAEEFRQKYFDFKELEKYKKQASNNAMDLKQIANMQKRAAADEGIRMLAKAMGDTVNKHGMIRASKIDAVLAQVSDFYNLETNVKIFGESENGEQIKTLTDYAQVYDRGAREKIDKLLKLRKDRQGKALTTEEMKLWAQILGAMRATINQYNGLYKDGKWFDRTKVAGDLAKDVVSYFGYNTEKRFKNVFLEGLYKTGKWLKENYFYSVISPETLIEGLEGYAHRGVLKTFFHSVRDASALADTVRAKLLIKFETFLDSNENVWEEKNRKIKFREKLNKKSIDLFGNEITLGEAIYLYGLCKREHAQAGLAKEGIKIYDENGKLKKQIREIDAEKARDYLYNQFDAVDRKYIDMVEEFFNKTSTEMKSKADLEYLGYSNTISGYYIPILRDRFSRDRRTTDRRSSIADIITVYNEQFNQHVTQNAKPCEITNIQQIVSTHAKGLADYSCLYMPLKSFDRLYNAPVILDDGRSTTIREILNDVWPDADNYLADLFGDIQGVGRPTGRFDTLDKLAQKITNTWVPSTLSGNLSVIMNQTTSYISASQAIEPKYLVQAMGAIGHNMKEIGDRADEYSKIILSRSFEEGAIRSQTNVEQVNKVGKFLGKGIEYTDRQICLLIFHAAEIKAEANGDGAIGTVENSRAAAIIADKVIQETQSMTSPAERGAWQRSPNMLSRAVTQFAGDSMKSFSYLYSSVARFFAHLNRVKARDTTYEADLKQDAKKIGRSVATIAATSAYMAAIAWLMRILLNTTEDEPEEEALNVLGDFAGNVVGIMPLVSDVYSYFVDGYEITPTSIDLINDTMKSTQNMLSLVGRSVSGKNVTYEETVKGIRGSLVSIGSLTGIPINPIIKQATGLVRRISPSAVYWYDSALSSESFSHDLERALEKGDERLAQTILEMRYKHEGTGEVNGEEILEISRLYQVLDEEGKYRAEVIPQRIPEEITKRKDRKKFESVYGEASGAVIKLIDSLEYKNLSDEEKIMAIKNTYKLYYNKAKSSVLGTEITNAEAYAMILGDTSNLYLSQAKKSSMEAYEGKAGKEVSVKEQVGEYLKRIDLTDEEYTVINYALGYRGKESTAKFLEYVNTLNLSDKDREQIAKRLGFIVEKGKITEDPKK